MKKYVLSLNEANIRFIQKLLEGKTFSLSGRVNDITYADGTPADPWQDSANGLIEPILQKYSRFRIEQNPNYFFLHGQFDREEKDYFTVEENGCRVPGFNGVKYATPTVTTTVFLDGYYNVIVINTREHSIRAMFKKYWM